MVGINGREGLLLGLHANAALGKLGLDSLGEVIDLDRGRLDEMRQRHVQYLGIDALVDADSPAVVAEIPRERVITVVHFAFEALAEVKGSDDAAEARWFDIYNLPELAFDHRTIIHELFAPNEKMHWAVEPDLMDSSFAPLYRGIWSFLSAPKSRRDLCLLKRAPETDTTQRLNGDYGAFNELALRVKQARDLFLIVGPPGTGKTSFGLLTTVKEELTEPTATVLLTAYTNRAVDEICSKLCAEQIPFVRLGGGLRCAEPYRPYLLEEQLKDVKSLDALKERLEATRVFVGTVSTLNGATELFSLKSFSCLSCPCRLNARI